MPKYIKELTKEQEGQMKAWADKWVEIGLQTGEIDKETFEKNIKLAYKKAKVPFPKKPIIYVSSPLVGALASSMADNIISNGKGESFSAVDSAVDSAVGSAVGSAVDSAVRSAVGSAVDSAVDSAVRSAVGSAVRSAVGSAVDSAKLQWHYWFGGQFWVGWGWGYWGPSSISFLTEVCKLKLSKDIQERAWIYQKLCESVNYFWTNKHFVMVCARPVRICREDNRLHSDQVKAIEYPDGWGLYALDGVILPEDLWEKIVSKTMTFKEIMAIEISDQRTVALKYNPEAIIKENAKLVDKDNRNNELYLIEDQQINKDLSFPKIWFLKMLCPTGRTFIEGVPPDEAEKNPNASAMQALLCGLTLSEYSQMELES